MNIAELLQQSIHPQAFSFDYVFPSKRSWLSFTNRTSVLWTELVWLQKLYLH